MSKSRTYKAPYPKKDEYSGIRKCRGGCGRDVPKGKIYWCNDDACLDAYMVRSNPGHARKRVLERDHGICAGCGADTEQIRRVLRALNRKTIHPISPHDLVRAKYFRWLHWLRRAYPWIKRNYGHMWEMDHILPVVEGGGGCGLDNLRTLCLGCHKEATKALAARRAAQRKGVGQESLFETEKNFTQAADSRSTESCSDKNISKNRESK